MKTNSRSTVVLPIETEHVAPGSQGRLAPDWSLGENVSALLNQPRVALGSWPTPLHRVSDQPTVWVKRDDLSGFGRGGAKTRKLECLLGAFNAGQYNELIVVTGNVSNLVFDLLELSRLKGVRTQIFVVNYPYVDHAERAHIFRSASTEVHLVGPNPLSVIALAVGELRRRRQAGARPFLLLPGAAHPASIVGNAAGFLELLQQCAQLRIAPKAVFVSVATGATVAGFAIAARAVAVDGGPSVRVIGVAIDRAPLRFLTWAMIRWTERSLKLGARVPSVGCELVQLEGNTRFATFQPDVLDACERVHAQHGLRIDPIFGGKTWLAMERAMQRERDLSSNVVYWHCGYTPEWQLLNRGGAS